MPLKQGNIYFHYLVPSFYFPQRNEKKDFLKGIFKEHQVRIATVNFIFCSDSYLLALNKRYLNHHYRTDIITFDLSSNDKLNADVFISVHRAEVNAGFFNVSRDSELLRLLIHGTLHLCGHADKTPVQFKNMKKLEEKFLDAFHVKRRPTKKL